MLKLATATAIVAALLLTPAAARTPTGPKAAIAKVLTRQLQGGFSTHSQTAIYAAIKPADINHDGVPDWQVDFDAFGSAWCGTGGCRYQLWLGQKNGVPRRVFDRQIRTVEHEQRGDQIVFVFDFHGSECGGYGSEACPGEFTWNANRGRMVLLPTPRKHTSQRSPINPDL